MPRLDRVLARRLHRAKRRRELTPEQSAAMDKVLADDSRLQQFVTERVFPMAGCLTAVTASFNTKADRPVLDWIKENWMKILAALVAFALSLI